MLTSLVILALTSFIPPAEVRPGQVDDGGVRGSLIYGTDRQKIYPLYVTDGGAALVTGSTTNSDYVHAGQAHDAGMMGPLMHGTNGTHVWDIRTTDEGILRTVSEPVELYIAKDTMWDETEASIFSIQGKRTLGWNSTSVLGDVAQYLDTTQDLLTPVVPASTYYIRSSNLNDSYDGGVGGTGAQQVRYVYLPADGGYQQVGSANLNGITGVSIGAGYDFFQWAEVSKIGTSEVSLGNITISTTSGTGAPATSTIVEYIAAGGNRSLSGRYKIPPYSMGYIMDWTGSAVGNDQDARLRATVFSDDGHQLSTVFHFVDTQYIIGNQTNFLSNLHYFGIPAGAEIKISSIPTAAGAANRMSSCFHIIVHKMSGAP